MNTGKSIKIGTSPIDFMNNLSYRDITGHVIIEGGSGSGKTNLVLDILRQHHQNGGKFCYFSPREDIAVLDAVHRVDANLTILRQIQDSRTLSTETTEAITAFLNNQKNLVITTERFLSVLPTSAILDAVRKGSMNMDLKNRNDLPGLFIIDDAYFISDDSIAKLMEVARRANIIIMAAFQYAMQHPLTIQNTATRILMGGLSIRSIDVWRNITGLDISFNAISIGQAWVIPPDRDLPTIHDVWNGHRVHTVQEQ